MTNLINISNPDLLQVMKDISKPSGLNIPKDMPIDDLLHIFKASKQVKRTSQFWIGDCLVFAEKNYGEKYSQFIEATDYKYGSLRNLKSLCSKIELSSRNDNLSFAHHKTVAKFKSSVIQIKWLKFADTNNLDSIQLRQAINDEEMRNESSDVEGTFKTVVIDLPWRLSKIERELKHNKFGFTYPVMNDDQLKDLPIKDKLATEAFVYLWVTQKSIPVGIRLFEEWNLTYIFMMVWHKNGGLQPAGLPQDNAEFILVGKKGSPPFSELIDFETCFDADSREHSRKPDKFYDLIKRVSPGPHLEMFGLENREGWDIWPKNKILGKD